MIGKSSKEKGTRKIDAVEEREENVRIRKGTVSEVSDT